MATTDLMRLGAGTMLVFVMIFVALACGALALHAGDAARKARVDLRSLQQESRAEVLRLQETIAEQDRRLQTMQGIVVDLRRDMEQLQAAPPAFPDVPDSIPTPRAVSG